MLEEGSVGGGTLDALQSAVDANMGEGASITQRFQDLLMSWTKSGQQKREALKGLGKHQGEY